jgi:hypothetical protein
VNETAAFWSDIDGSGSISKQEVMVCAQIAKSLMELYRSDFGGSKKANPILMGRKVLAAIFRIFDTNGTTHYLKAADLPVLLMISIHWHDDDEGCRDRVTVTITYNLLQTHCGDRQRGDRGAGTVNHHLLVDRDDNEPGD